MSLLNRTQFIYMLRGWLSGLRLLGVYLGLFLACLVLGLMFGSGAQILGFLIIAAAIGALGALFLMYYFESAVLLIIVTALAIPVDIPTGTATKIPVSMVLTLALSAIWVASMYIRRHFKLIPSPLNAPILLLGCLFCLSMVWGTVWRDPVVVAAGRFIFVQAASLSCFIASLAATLLIGNFCSTDRRLITLLAAFLLIGSLAVFADVFHVRQEIVNLAGLGMMWVAVLSYATIISWRNLGWHWRIGALIILCAVLYRSFILTINWFSGWAPSLVALSVATWIRSKRLAIILGLTFLALLAIKHEYVMEVIMADQEGGSDQRPIIWRQNWSIIREHWVFGTGPAGYAPYNMTYFPTYAWSNHNNYLDIVNQFGLVGTITWFWLGITGVYHGWQTWRQSTTGIRSAISLAATAGWVGAQASMMLGDWVLPFAYNVGVGGFKHTVFSWIFLGTIISVNNLNRIDRANAS